MSDRLEAASDSDPRLGYAMGLARASYEEAMRSIGSYGTAGGRGAPALFTEKHQTLLQLTCFQMALHLLRPSSEAMDRFAEAFPLSGSGMRRWVPRPVVDMPCGHGKTESAKAVIYEGLRLHRKGLLGDGPFPGILLLADDLAQLDSVAVALVKRGLKHGRDFGMYYGPKTRTGGLIQTKSIEEDACPRMPVLLMCVQQLTARTRKERQQGKRLRPEKGADQMLLLANGERRQLVIKDEVLLGVETHYFELASMELTRDTLYKHVNVAYQACYDRLRDSLERCLQAVRGVADGLAEPGAAAIAELPPMDEGLALLADAAAEDLSDSDVPHKVLKSISQIGGLADLSVSVQFRKKNVGRDNRDRILICKAVKTWPFDRVPEFITLDANFRADLLTQAMKQYERASVLNLMGCTPEELKRMHPLQVHISKGLKGGQGQGGRGDLGNQRTRTAYIDLIIRTLLPIYKDSTRRILIFTFKDTKKVSYRDEMKAALIKAGIDEECIHYGSAGIKPCHRVVVETWGRHTSTNAFVDCSAVFFLGVLRYEPEQLMTSLWGAEGDEGRSLAGLSLSVSELDRSMLVCHVVQAILRTMARVTVEGMCPPCDAYLILRDPSGNEVALERGMRKLLGDFTLLPWEEAMTKVQLTATIPDLIVQTVLQMFAEGRDRVSFSEVRGKVMASTNTKSSVTWAKYRQEADRELLTHGIGRNAEGKGARAWVQTTAKTNPAPKTG